MATTETRVRYVVMGIGSNWSSRLITNDIIKSIVDYKKNRKVLILKNFNKDVPSWDEFINYLNDSSNMPANDYDYSEYYVKGTVMSKEHFYYYMPSHGYLGQTSKNIEDNMREVFKTSGGMSAVFVTFSSNIIDVRPHRDPKDNFYWQCIGSTEWVFDGKSHTVEPGDVVFIPDYAEHSVNFSMPRAAISFLWDINQSPVYIKYDA
jgi:mannose-6-phosphate isomerase-like protein (cupin superfamily)